MSVAVAAVETAHFGGTDWDDDVPLPELVAAAAIVTAGEWWRAVGAPAVVVEPARSSARSSSARGRAGTILIRLAVGQRDRATLAHELAHALAGIDEGHGPVFRAALVDVVDVLGGGAVEAGALARRFVADGLHLAPRRWVAPWRWSGDGFVIR